MMRSYPKGILTFSILLSLCVVGNGVAWGNENQPVSPMLTVSGKGTVQLPPTKAIVSLAVETAGESLEKVQTDNRNRMERVLARMLELGIKNERLQTSALRITPHYPPPPRRRVDPPRAPEVPKIIGYTVHHSLTVEVHQLDKVGRVVDEALQAGANRFSRITWALKDEQPARLEALKAAAQKAQEKARTLADALHVRLVRLLTVTEGGAAVIPPRPMKAMAMRSMAMDEGGSVPLSPGELSIQASVTLVFEINVE